MYQMYIIMSIMILFFGVECQLNTIKAPENPNPVTTMTPSSNIPTASPFRVSVPEVDCTKTIQTQLEMNICAGRRASLSEEKLEMLIEALSYSMETEQYEILLGIQREWEEITVRHCEWEADFFDGGSIKPTWYANCLNGMYRQRINTLRRNLCQGNGMAGECDDSLRYKD